MPPTDPRFSIHNVTVRNLRPSFLSPVRQLTHVTKYKRSGIGIPFITKHGKQRRGY